MPSDRVLADDQFRGDLPVGPADGYKSQHLSTRVVSGPLSLGGVGDRRRSRSGVAPSAANASLAASRCSEAVGEVKPGLVGGRERVADESFACPRPRQAPEARRRRATTEELDFDTRERHVASSERDVGVDVLLERNEARRGGPRRIACGPCLGADLPVAGAHASADARPRLLDRVVGQLRLLGRPVCPVV